MIDKQHVRWLENELSPSSDIIPYGDLIEKYSFVPDFYTDAIDKAYRDGFEDGFDYCVERVDDMYRRRGFVRVREIVNILWDWSERTLRPWRIYGKGKYKDMKNVHPKHEQKESWSEIRQRILRRDGACVRCGDVIKMEVDHIIEVQEGGLPTDENLRTLCAVCHKGKRIWSK